MLQLMVKIKKKFPGAASPLKNTCLHPMQGRGQGDPGEPSQNTSCTVGLAEVTGLDHAHNFGGANNAPIADKAVREPELNGPGLGQQISTAGGWQCLFGTGINGIFGGSRTSEVLSPRPPFPQPSLCHPSPNALVPIVQFNHLNAGTALVHPCPREGGSGNRHW